MKIGIDISPIVYETGVSWYTYHLVKNILLEDEKNQYVLYGGSLRRGSEIRRKLKDMGGNFEVRLFPFPPSLTEFVWNVLHTMPIETFTGRLDVFHSSDWVQPPSKAYKVTTVHDLTPIKFPNLSHPKIVSAHQRRLKWVKKEVNAVIVPSISTKNDLLDFGIEEEKLFVISEAIDPGFVRASIDEVRIIKSRYRISGKYLLAVGLAPRKNISRIIEAYEKIRAGEQLKLVVIGESATPPEHTRGVIFVGHVPFHDLPAFYTGAEALVYTSLYEGFGLPILEAFACDTPVVTSNISSMPETASGAAILVNPYDVENISSGIKEAIVKSEDFVKKGRTRLKNFSWVKSARETIKIYGDSVLR